MFRFGTNITQPLLAEFPWSMMEHITAMPIILISKEPLNLPLKRDVLSRIQSNLVDMLFWMTLQHDSTTVFLNPYNQIETVDDDDFSMWQSTYNERHKYASAN